MTTCNDPEARVAHCKRMSISGLAAQASLAIALAAAAPAARAGDGDLDAGFGTAGKVQLAPSPGYTAPVATDVAVQPDGRIVVVGYETTSAGGSENWRITRLEPDGSPDTSFAPDHSGTVHYFAGATGTRAQAVALRPDGRIVVGGNFSTGAAYSEADVMQLTPSGDLDTTFASAEGYIEILPQAGDRSTLSRLLVLPDGRIVLAGTYYDNQAGFNGNQFFFDRVAADGSDSEPFAYQFGSGPNQDDHALDLAVDGQGRYVLCGYHRGASGNYDFAAIRIRADLYDVDTAFGDGGQTTVDFGDDGDYCNALVVTPAGYVVLGGQANGQAAMSLLDPDGHLFEWYSGGIGHPTLFPFAFGSGSAADTITRLMIDRYDAQQPRVVAVGTGNQSGVPYGLMFGVARVYLPGYSNLQFDPSFNGGTPEVLFFAEHFDGIGLLATRNHGNSAAWDGGRLVLVGDTQVPGGTDMAVARLAAFDGIHLDGFDVPSY
jgi:uncharacterized delta-60 repeat protein